MSKKQTPAPGGFPVLLTRIYLLCMVTGFLLYCGSEGYQAFQRAKVSAFYLLTGGYLIVLALYGAESLLVGAAKWKSPRQLWGKSSLLQRGILLFLLVTWISALLSPHFPLTLWGATRNEGAVTVTLYALSFLAVSVWGRGEDRLLTAAFGLGITLFDLIAILQLYGGNPLGLYPQSYTYADAGKAYSGAYLGTTGNADLGAALLCLAIPLLLVAVLRGKDRLRLLLWIPLLLSVFVLVKMWVLAGLVGVTLGLVLALPFAFPWKKKQKNLLLALIAAGFLVGLTLLWFIRPPEGFLYELHALLHGQADPTFASGRLHIWHQVLGEIPKHLLLGAGPDTMALAELEGFSRWDPDLGQLLTAQIDIAHNEYLNILYHQGLAGLAAWLFALGAGFCLWLRRAPASPRAAALGSAVLCYCVQAFFGLSMCMTAPFFWLALGLLDRELRRQ